MLPIKTRMRHWASWCQVKHLDFSQLHSVTEVANCIYCVVIVFPGSGSITETTAHHCSDSSLSTLGFLSLQKTQSEASEGGEFLGSEAEIWC